ncbi:putative calcium-transporting ATPase [Trypanosoma rangeli]|uniref:Putative calcium-transporting ATPase n=1 Tax=Trypanosoma rangeli TaxID=5698 RepID=A0A3S5ISK9_TRYRA|nr:putative calcium-transporting ATPase [Trypanosoma rangeli]RNF11920.1 putative calcium-transporting ATPase [Trypanosoma rangeli]|eukprot:RNF11920.1 putative calcium-transporting ATPase [Trypanosoma rangeli]
MQRGHTSVPICSTNARECAANALITALPDIIGHKRIGRFSSEIAGHQGLLNLLDVHCENLMAWNNIHGIRGGILDTSVHERRERFGANYLARIPKKSFISFVKESVEGDRILQLLIGSAVLSIVVGMITPEYREGNANLSTGWVEGAAIFLSVVIVVTLGALNNYRKQEQFAHIIESEDQTRQLVLVWRYETASGGELLLRPMEIRSEDVVVGDVVQISAGMELTFDAILFDNRHIVCDECSVTGENEEIVKDLHSDPFLISGSSILDGSSDAVAVVCAVGERSFAGEIAMTIHGTEKRNTPLQDQLEALAERIGKFGLLAAILTFTALFLKEAYRIVVYGSPFSAMKFFENLTTAIAIAVVAVPEGLPLSVTISLAYSMRRMLQDGNLVRHLAACETMGGATVLCTDKTGTITLPEMKLARIFFQGHSYLREGNNLNGIIPGLDAIVTVSSPHSAAHLMECVAANTLDPELGRVRSRTGEALMQLKSSICIVAEDGHITPFSYDEEPLLAVMRDKSSCVRFPFSSLQKKSTTVLKLPNGIYRVYVSGAPEMVLASCQSVVVENGRLAPLDDARRVYYESILQDYAEAGLRTVCCAYGDINPLEEAVGLSGMPLTPPNIPLTFVVLIALEEAIRPEVPRSLELCARAGLRVIMITGDAMLTAINIAARCGLLDLARPSDFDTCHTSLSLGSPASLRAVETLIAEGYVMSGTDFRSLKDEEFLDKFMLNICVLARATPLDKKRVLRLLKLHNPLAVVAVTGDGTNDAPALKSSDVGFAMNTGSDVAKRASDIVLLDNNFAGMVKATMWGRNVKGNIRKFLQFQLTVNCVACLIAFSGALMNEQNMSPLKPVQLLWLNLIMDTLAALALATELPSESALLSRPPESRNAPVILPSMWFQVATQGGFQFVLQMHLLFSGNKHFKTRHVGEGLPDIFSSIEYFGPKHLSIVFNVFVIMQVMNFFNARLLTQEETFFGRWGDSSGLLLIVSLIVVLQVCIVQYGGRLMSTVPLTAYEWMVCVMYAMWSLVVGAISRWWWWKVFRGKVRGTAHWTRWHLENLCNPSIAKRS